MPPGTTPSAGSAPTTRAGSAGPVGPVATRSAARSTLPRTGADGAAAASSLALILTGGATLALRRRLLLDS